MGIISAILKVTGRIAMRLILVGSVVYIEYRVAGGPPIRKVIKAAKDKKLEKEIKQAAKEGKIIYLDPEKVV